MHKKIETHEFGSHKQRAVGSRYSPWARGSSYAPQARLIDRLQIELGATWRVH